ncbi:TGF-beta receptor type-1 isoform X4 [Brachionus plicatilis]|uniref:receptor protein serine/threonine kinase n=1 Tax=Brachionus plicatilis TaxID=10195 RepID=A0A3M7R8E9_BRAPC|nr:TGF-beta receptor type-1 isoform X4 [Brachionus plicatilis]
MYKKFRLESAKSKFVKTHQMYRGSLNTENTSSCAASPVHPPAPLKPLLTASPYTSTSSSSSSSSSAASTSQSTANTSIKSHLYASDKHADAFEPFIQISSPLSTPSSALCHTLSVQTAQTPSSELEWSGSGSGAGFPQCVQRTIARQIRLVYPCVGKGRFGEVYKGEWRGEFVAVKTFNSADEKSWENECGIYSTSGFRHENILGFIAADNIDRGLYTELWLITEYHENGSLFDYLSGNQISAQVAVKMALSIVNGLVHLHMPIESCNGKPALAHCDLKSKNILVKSDLSCCIGDLGLALSGDRDGKVVQQGSVRTGTKRYMAPEILAKRIDARYLENFQKAEMYSVALVLWELLRSCQFDDERTGALCSFEHKMPYFEYIQGDPDEALMSKIVCEQKIRPSVCAEWRHNKIMSGLLRLAEELWVENPDERLNALRLKKSLSKIRTNLVQRATLPTILA